MVAAASRDEERNPATSIWTNSYVVRYFFMLPVQNHRQKAAMALVQLSDRLQEQRHWETRPCYPKLKYRLRCPTKSLASSIQPFMPMAERSPDVAIEEAGGWSKRPGHVVWIGLFEPSDGAGANHNNAPARGLGRDPGRTHRYRWNIRDEF